MILAPSPQLAGIFLFNSIASQKLFNSCPRTVFVASPIVTRVLSFPQRTKRRSHPMSPASEDYEDILSDAPSENGGSGAHRTLTVQQVRFGRKVTRCMIIPPGGSVLLGDLQAAVDLLVWLHENSRFL